jgi:hypothetical protein
MRVVDVENRVVAARELGEDAQIGGVPGHAVHAVHADQTRLRPVGAQQSFEVGGIVVLIALHARAANRRELGALVDRLVSPPVDEDRAAAGEHGYHGEMN